MRKHKTKSLLFTQILETKFPTAMAALLVIWALPVKVLKEFEYYFIYQIKKIMLRNGLFLKESPWTASDFLYELYVKMGKEEPCPWWREDIILGKMLTEKLKSEVSRIARHEKKDVLYDDEDRILIDLKVLIPDKYLEITDERYEFKERERLCLAALRFIVDGFGTRFFKKNAEFIFLSWYHGSKTSETAKDLDLDIRAVRRIKKILLKKLKLYFESIKF